jgi:hypothetical protein
MCYLEPHWWLFGASRKTVDQHRRKGSSPAIIEHHQGPKFQTPDM